MCLGGVIGKSISWQAIFYTFGGASLIWTALWFTYIYESPAVHKTIQAEEKLFLEASIPKVGMIYSFQNEIVIFVIA
jgi:hypothetical protein